jgi:hypothetical protein
MGVPHLLYMSEERPFNSTCNFLLIQTPSKADIIVRSPSRIERREAGLSFWIYRKSKDGKKSLFAVDINFPLIIMIVALLFALIVPYCLKVIR